LFKKQLPKITLKEKSGALNSKINEIYVLTQMNEVVGFLIFHFYRKDPIAYIYIDYIATKGDNFGFGAKLIEELKAYGDDQRFS
jgi:hypothetical protein